MSVTARNLNDFPGWRHGRALASATVCHCQQGDYVSAVATGLEAVDAYGEDDLAGRSNALQSIALALLALEAFDLAEAAAERAVHDACAARDGEREARARGVFGAILVRRERFDAARHQFRSAGHHHRLVGDTVEMKRTAMHLGDTYRAQATAFERAGRAPQARFYWRQALRAYRIALATGASADDDAIATTAAAECHLCLGDIGSARANIARALHLAARVSRPATLAAGHLGESRILEAIGDLKGAEWACERACAAAETLVHEPMLARCLDALAAIHDAQGRFTQASDVKMRSRELALERAVALARIREEINCHA